MSEPVLQVILASTRPGRLGEPVARWFVQRAEQHGGFTVELLDLKEIGLPMLDEPKHPMLGEYEHEHTTQWSATISRGDAYVLVMPEYNHSFTAPLKNALDYLNKEWAHKPVAFVSYGGVAAGTRAATAIKSVVTALRMHPLFEAVHIAFIRTLVEDGVFRPNQITEDAVKPMLDELARLASALRPLRSA